MSLDDFDLETLFEAEELHRRYNRIDHTYKPGPFAIERYPKHREMFASGKRFRHRCFMGGNGCIAPWTLIETAEGERRVSELLGVDAFAVHSWDGESRCVAQASGVFLKEFAPAFRIHLDNGKWFDCSRTHRVLTTEGWVQVDQLIRASGGLRCTRTAQGSTANCGAGDHQCGEPLRRKSDTAQEPPPSRDDVRARTRWEIRHADEAERTRSRIHASLPYALQTSRLYDPARVAALCAPFADPTVRLDLQWSGETRQALRQLAAASCQSRVWTEDDQAQPQFSASATGVEPSGRLPSGDCARSWLSPQNELLFLERILPGQWPDEDLRPSFSEWSFFLSDTPSLIGGNKIASITPLGIQPILDFTVDETACYFASGVIHHNTGKTYGLGGYEVACHATGLYPDWWDGLRYDHPVNIRACGDTRETVRDIIQVVLFGDYIKTGIEDFGTGMIPRHLLGQPKVVQNTNGSIDFCPVRHKNGDWSMIELRAYEQGRKAFQGTSRHFIWEDEEPPAAVHQENVQRGRGVDGRMLLTFTPLSGFSEVVNGFLGWEEANRKGASRFTVSCDWDDVPHLDEEWKRQTLAETPLHMRKARKSGIPTSGVGMVYPVEEEFIVVRPFEIPSHFRRVAGFDHGWHNTAAVWVAYDKDEDVAYVYAEYKRGEIPIESHATALKARGDWIPFLGDSSQRESDGKKIIDKYKALGVEMRLPDKSVDAGIQEVYSRLESGRLKFFSTCGKLIDEFRRYRYNEKGGIVKENDHLLDALRYAIYAGLKHAKHKPTARNNEIVSNITFG